MSETDPLAHVFHDSRTWYAGLEPAIRRAIVGAAHKGEAYDRLLAVLARDPERPTRGEDEVAIAIVMATELPAVPRGWPRASDPQRQAARRRYQAEGRRDEHRPSHK